ncbi:MAG: cytochrome c-type biogenesis protein CcmH [Pseudomonadota bacterium]|nr:cytochrome c-type biogenesis protein CcmH [Pseudomonadota bacterium]
MRNSKGFPVFSSVKSRLIAFILIAFAAAANADDLADRMHQLTQDLRCLVCQNESLADSHAPLAMDLKREIRTKMEQGESDAQIRDFLLQRYGDFVNYNPPLKASTLLLWVGPLLLLGAGGFVVWRAVRGRVARSGAGAVLADDAEDTP